MRADKWTDAALGCVWSGEGGWRSTLVDEKEVISVKIAQSGRLPSSSTSTARVSFCWYVQDRRVNTELVFNTDTLANIYMAS